MSTTISSNINIQQQTYAQLDDRESNIPITLHTMESVDIYSWASTGGSDYYWDNNYTTYQILPSGDKNRQKNSGISMRYKLGIKQIGEFIIVYPSIRVSRHPSSAITNDGKYMQREICLYRSISSNYSDIRTDQSCIKEVYHLAFDEFGVVNSNFRYYRPTCTSHNQGGLQCFYLRDNLAIPNALLIANMTLEQFNTLNSTEYTTDDIIAAGTKIKMYSSMQYDVESYSTKPDFPKDRKEIYDGDEYNPRHMGYIGDNIISKDDAQMYGRMIFQVSDNCLYSSNDYWWIGFNNISNIISEEDGTDYNKYIKDRKLTARYLLEYYSSLNQAYCKENEQGAYFNLLTDDDGLEVPINTITIPSTHHYCVPYKRIKDQYNLYADELCILNLTSTTSKQTDRSIMASDYRLLCESSNTHYICPEIQENLGNICNEFYGGSLRRMQTMNSSIITIQSGEYYYHGHLLTDENKYDLIAYDDECFVMPDSVEWLAPGTYRLPFDEDQVLIYNRELAKLQNLICSTSEITLTSILYNEGPYTSYAHKNDDGIYYLRGDEFYVSTDSSNNSSSVAYRYVFDDKNNSLSSKYAPAVRIPLEGYNTQPSFNITTSSDGQIENNFYIEVNGIGNSKNFIKGVAYTYSSTYTTNFSDMELLGIQNITNGSGIYTNKYTIPTELVKNDFKNKTVYFYAAVNGNITGYTPYSTTINSIHFSEKLTVSSTTFTYDSLQKANTTFSVTYGTSAISCPSGSKSGDSVKIYGDGNVLINSCPLSSLPSTFNLMCQTGVNNIAVSLKDSFNTSYALGNIIINSTKLYSPTDSSIKLFQSAGSTAAEVKSFSDNMILRFTSPSYSPASITRNQDFHYEYTIKLKDTTTSSEFQITNYTYDSSIESKEQILFTIPSEVKIAYGHRADISVTVTMYSGASHTLNNRQLSDAITYTAAGIFRGEKPIIANNTLSFENLNRITLYSNHVLPQSTYITRDSTGTWSYGQGQNNNFKFGNNIQLGYTCNAFSSGAYGQKIKLAVQAIKSGTAGIYYTLGTAEVLTIATASDSTGTSEIQLSAPSGLTLEDFNGGPIKIVGQTYNIFYVDGQYIEVPYSSFNDIDFIENLQYNSFFIARQLDETSPSFSFNFNKGGITLNTAGSRIYPTDFTNTSEFYIGQFQFYGGNAAESSGIDTYKNNGISLCVSTNSLFTSYSIIPFNDNTGTWTYKWKTSANPEDIKCAVSSDNLTVFPCFGTYDSVAIHGTTCPTSTVLDLYLNIINPHIFPYDYSKLETKSSIETLYYKILTNNKVDNKYKSNQPLKIQIDFAGEFEFNGSPSFVTSGLVPPLIQSSMPPYSSESFYFTGFKDEGVVDKRSRLIFKFKAAYDESYILNNEAVSTEDKYLYSGTTLRSGMTDPLEYIINKYTYNGTDFIKTASLTMDSNSVNLTSTYTDNNLLYTAALPVYCDNGVDVLNRYSVTAYNPITHHSYNIPTSISSVNERTIRRAISSDSISDLFHIGRVGAPEIKITDIVRQKPEGSEFLLPYFKLIVSDNGFGRTFTNRTVTSSDFYCWPTDDIKIHITELDTNSETPIEKDFIGISDNKISITSNSIIGSLPISSIRTLPEGNRLIGTTLPSTDWSYIYVEEDHGYNFKIYIDLEYNQYSLSSGEYTATSSKLTSNYTTYLPDNFPTVAIRKNKIGLNKSDLNNSNEDLLIFPKHRIDYGAWHKKWDHGYSVNQPDTLEYYPNIVAIGGDKNTYMPEYNGKSTFSYLETPPSDYSGAYIGFYARTDTSQPEWMGSIGFDYKPATTPSGKPTYTLNYIHGPSGGRVKTKLKPPEVQNGILILS